MIYSLKNCYSLTDKSGLNDGKADLDGVPDGAELRGDQQLEV